MLSNQDRKQIVSPQRSNRRRFIPPAARLLAVVGAVALLALSTMAVDSATSGSKAENKATVSTTDRGTNSHGQKVGHRTSAPSAANATAPAATAGPTGTQSSPPGTGGSTPTPAITSAPTGTTSPTAVPTGTAAPAPIGTASPTARPTAVVTPVPTSAATPAPQPTPTATPAPTATPTATPAGSVYAVPASIDGSGGTDVAAALNHFVATVPNGGTVAFPAGKTYKVSGQFLVDHRSGLTFLGNGSTIKSVCSNGAATTCSVFAIMDSSSIVVRNLIVTGNAATPGVFDSSHQGQIGFRIVGGSSIEIDHCTVNNVFADGVDVDYWTNGVWVHDSVINRASRSGFVVLAGKNITVERNTFIGVSNTAGVFDLEPYQASGGTSNFKFLNNVITGFDFYFAANGGSMQQDIVVSGNVAKTGTIRSILGKIAPRPQRVTITNNVAYGPAKPFVADPWTLGNGGIFIWNTDVLKARGNSIPFNPAHKSVIASGCTSVSYDGK